MNAYKGQDDVFFKEEGDRWFARNNSGLAAANEDDRVLAALDGLLDPPPASILEVGAANGFRLASLQATFGARCVAVEPSLSAIKQGQSTFPEVEFRRGLASDIPLDDQEQFNLVIVSFVLHWVDRSSIGMAIGSLDQCVQDGGILVVSDFMPDQPTCNPYHHRDDDTMTFKQDYGACFTSLGTYAVVRKVLTEHGSSFDEISESDRRVATVVLRKDLRGLYLKGMGRTLSEDKEKRDIP